MIPRISYETYESLTPMPMDLTKPSSVLIFCEDSVKLLFLLYPTPVVFYYPLFYFQKRIIFIS
jgi:hypothetical protein